MSREGSRRRYQGMRDVVVDLRAARRRLEIVRYGAACTGQRLVARQGSRQGARAVQERFLVRAAVPPRRVALVVVGLAGSCSWPRWSPAPTAGSGKPSVAVLYFENNTGNPQLDWMRTGLTDMLVTDLSQSPDVEVLELRSARADPQRHEAPGRSGISFDTVQELARARPA